MRRMSLVAAASAALLLVSYVVSQDKQAESKKKTPPFRIDKRVPWTLSKVKGSPEPPAPYKLEVAFPKLKFSEPLELATAPGIDRLFVVERHGKIVSFANDPQADKAELLVDVGKTTYGLAFHPDFQKNGFIYVTYVLDPDKTLPKGTRVVRFQTRKDNPLQVDPASAKVIFEWPSGGHNGGCLRFGPDGYLYIATGDGSGIADELQTGQDITDHLSSILRIDVDRPEEGKNYGVPKDNPFVKFPGAKPEIYAYGLRQPWKMSFDRKTGDLWAGEVGQDLWESVHKIEKGGNYGWSVVEGSHPFRPERKKQVELAPFRKPIVEHPHSEFRSLTGGYVYHGKRLPELVGAYIYGDFDTGRLWALRYTPPLSPPSKGEDKGSPPSKGGDKGSPPSKGEDKGGDKGSPPSKGGDKGGVAWQQELLGSTLRVIAFGETHAGELYVLDFMGGQVHRLAPAPKTAQLNAFPRKLSATGLFTSTKDLTPAPGLIPYTVNAQLWSDHAIKERFLALPGQGKIEFETIEYPQPAPGAPRGWRFPDGTVAVKTFFLETEPGNPASRRRLETRILHFEKLAGNEEVGDQYWHGYTYVWNDDQSDAELLGARGLDRVFEIKDRQAPGGVRKQTWHFPSRNECIMCHTMPAKFVLGINTLQLNKDHDYGGGVVANQLAVFAKLGLFAKPLPNPPALLPRLHDYDDPKVDLDHRARSYLHANCAHCHMKWGGGNTDFQLLATLALKDLGIVNTTPAHGALAITDARVLAPGAPERSLLALRMARLGLGRMPHIASGVVDERGVKLMNDWIKQLPK